ncbi:MAG: 3-phosphoshikimate 1-carboxyvinyltransferase [Treponema sp.]|jgi:3-phosphoshikimate 1-carboxyvinyltransferase|nr:3-phosphoshikimate 1-carboxyvinyltransferase [Treponema sp.]
MRAFVDPHCFSGTVTVPASKSHTIRRLLMAALSEEISYIENPLDSLDTCSCVEACRVLGADIGENRSDGVLRSWTVRGFKPGEGPRPGTSTPDRKRIINVGNSGTTLFLALAAAALGSVPVSFTGDSQIAKRSAGPLLDALAGLGAAVSSAAGPGEGLDKSRGYTPITIYGPWKGGSISLPCPTSQYLSALLIAAPLAPAGVVTEIEVPLLNERPYVEMTLAYLKAQGLKEALDSVSPGGNSPGSVYAAADFSWFRITGGASYRALNGPVPGDFSSAAFPAAAAVISGGQITLRGLDPGDTQGDKVFFDYLERMGCSVVWDTQAGKPLLHISGSRRLRGGAFDLNDAPDMFPVMAVLGAFAEGTTKLVNVAHARIKETDRIAVMAEELTKLAKASGSPGFCCEERPEGLVIQGGRGLRCPGGQAFSESPSVLLDSRGDHRIMMALACAALGLPGGAEIAGAEAGAATYPGFLELLNARCYT